jgi:hypothetical protein
MEVAKRVSDFATHTGKVFACNLSTWGRLKQGDQEFEASLVSVMSSRLVSASW